MKKKHLKRKNSSLHYFWHLCAYFKWFYKSTIKRLRQENDKNHTLENSHLPWNKVSRCRGSLRMLFFFKCLIFKDRKNKKSAFFVASIQDTNLSPNYSTQQKRTHVLIIIRVKTIKWRITNRKYVKNCLIPCCFLKKKRHKFFVFSKFEIFNVSFLDIFTYAQFCPLEYRCLFQISSVIYRLLEIFFSKKSSCF